MNVEETILFVCSREDFRPAPVEWVRWLALNADIYRVQQANRTNGLPAPTYAEWEEEHRQGIRFCAAMVQNRIVSQAAVHPNAQNALELRDVRTLAGFQRQGYGKAVVTFATEYMLHAAPAAVYRLSPANAPLQSLLELLGYRRKE